MAEEQSSAHDEREPVVTEKELEQLPRWARVAFAARCARRVQPLYVHAWPDALQKHVDALDKAVTLAERSVADVGDANTANAAAYAAATTDAYAIATAVAAANAAAHAANAAAYAAIATANDGGGDANAAANLVIATAVAAATTAVYAYAKMRKPTAHVMRRDFDLLVEAAGRFNWTDDTPVPPEFFGPLWPEGEPEGWPEEGKEPRLGSTEFELEVIGPPGVPAEEVVEQARQLAVLLDRLNRKSGGFGIQISDDVNVTEFETADVPDPQPVGGGC